jgi:hypothetical protein
VSAYDNDPRVRHVSGYRFVVVGEFGHEFNVWSDRPDHWFAGPISPHHTYTAPGLRDHKPSDGTTVGPFSSFGSAVYALIGDPQ